MTTIQLTLPDRLAKEAQQAGLLSPDLFEQWVRERLKKQKIDRLLSAMDRMAEIDDPQAMTAEEVAEQMAVWRTEEPARSPS